MVINSESLAISFAILPFILWSYDGKKC